ncbi:MAG TPA: hypothetical protein VHC18_12960 [Amycolatopsis sp.]|nr:hypothetical protein [Amycolatopsis sp.]
MTSGFGTVPDDLRQAAGDIGGAIRGVADLVWQGPSGDYGHAAVQHGWSDFIDDMKKAVHNLHDKADEHGVNLKGAAGAYEEQDAGVGQVIGGIGELIDSAGGSGSGSGGGSGFLDPAIVKRAMGGSISSRLEPEGGPEGAVY